MALRVLFLDIDGVLNSTRSMLAFGRYPQTIGELRLYCDEIAISLLQRFCDSAGISVVLSSSWRTEYSTKALADAFELPIVSATPAFGYATRAEEIDAWLQANPPVECYAIIDDLNDGEDSPMLQHQQSRFVLTDGHEGLTMAKFRELCALFNESPYAGKARKRW